jgi:hypothetical protein
VLYVYAITESPVPPARSGLRSTSLRVIGEAGPFAIVSEHEDLRLEASEDDLWTHESVVEKAMETGAVLPMRFGSSLADEKAVLAVLRERRSAFDRGLDRVRGAVELGVRAAIEAENGVEAGRQASIAEPAPTVGPGTAYMMGRLGRKRDAEQLAAQIHEPLAPLARASTLRLSTEGGLRLNAAYLIDRVQVESFQERVERLEREVDGARVVCTGPWPPYSFASLESES